MRNPHLSRAAAVLLATGLLTSLRSSDDETQPFSVPHHVDLGVPFELLDEGEQGTYLRAPGAEYFAQRAQAEPGRFKYSEEQGAWQDYEGEYFYLEREGESAYWQWVSAERLTRGRRHYLQYCSSCHGVNGDGTGLSGQHLRPAPRSFKQANFKFTKVVDDLPTDEAITQLVKRGLDGTPMLPWDIRDGELLGDIVQYIKALSPKATEEDAPGGWRDPFRTVGGVVQAEADPWSRADQAILRGKQVYHGEAGCHACHPGYVTSSELGELRKDPAGTEYRADLSYPVIKKSEYTVLGKEIWILPPDFTWHQLRVGGIEAGTTDRQALFETIASGIPGTSMPQWKGALSDEDIWALAYYVEDLINQYKDQLTKRAEFMAGLRGQ